MASRLIVNGDDFGQSAGINRGVARCHEAEILLSASLMVRWPAAAEAAMYARQHPALSVGLHIDLCEWTYVDDRWIPLYEVVPLSDESAVRQEIHRQVETFRQLTGANPTHVDSHQHVHHETLVRDAVLEIAARLQAPVRNCHPQIRYDGRFYGQGRNARACHELISREHLISLIRTLPDGITELSCHPAIGRDVSSVYLAEREMEVAVLCDPVIRGAVETSGVELISFREVSASPATPCVAGRHE